MSAPETKLDTRFSDADAVATSWNDTRQALEKAELFWITTVRRDGRPHTTRLVAVWLETRSTSAPARANRKPSTSHTSRTSS
jgi:hypothetical protein